MISVSASETSNGTRPTKAWKASSITPSMMTPETGTAAA